MLCVSARNISKGFMISTWYHFRNLIFGKSRKLVMTYHKYQTAGFFQCHHSQIKNKIVVIWSNIIYDCTRLFRDNFFIVSSCEIANTKEMQFLH